MAINDSNVSDTTQTQWHGMATPSVFPQPLYFMNDTVSSDKLTELDGCLAMESVATESNVNGYQKIRNLWRPHTKPSSLE